MLVANRGEIARRVLRTLHGLGIRSLAIYTEADRDAPHVREADEAELVSSYLAIDEIMVAAARVDAVHPGYGFLSENPAFARACEEMGVVFIGPSADAIELMGDKVRAKEAADRAGVPTVPTYTPETAEYPVLVKAAAGGGGRGMRVVERPEDLPEAMAAASREAAAGFGDDRVFLERYLPRARHIEVQVLGDTHGKVISLGERECSLQRRHQKVIEESPSPVVDAALRSRLGEEAVSLAQAAGYVGAGTVEFIADADDPSQHFFLEMNARLQVEHPVTELVTGLDLVELQLRVAAGEPLDIEVSLTGHAIEARVNAEDLRFFPSAGPVLLAAFPDGVRVDAAVETGSVVGTDYDSMIAKVIAHGPDRETAIARLDRALSQTAILGLETNVGFLRSLLARDDVRAGELTTSLIGTLDPPEPPLTDEEVAVAWASAQLIQRGDDPWQRVDGWRLGGVRAPSYWTLSVNGGDPIAIEHNLKGSDPFMLCSGEWIAHDGWAWHVTEPSADELHHAVGDGELRAPMPGSVLLVPRKVGDEVKAGEPVVVLESMKMELALNAPSDGTVTKLDVKVGDKVARDEIVAVVE
ncbi:acetyl/propionyl/methylcrotonyl-CoA carboxylase subunit alpha [Solirubrobacter phytolaccae]|uniref:acetyl/propionyl/methylcrotonyl-CoA carboxylase subunit alpha n=1 Tax=Solirubrobacter phytolaccae TaxID=1404360 RepID=UPI0022CE30E0|nr:biotin carboxylase N-terminal domain-containing protein [Solirubrobacter phytolaccae]